MTDSLFEPSDIRTWPRSLRRWFLYLAIVHAAFWMLVVILAASWKR